MRILKIFLLAITLAAQESPIEWKADTSKIWLTTTVLSAFTIYNKDQMVVSIGMDGSVTFGNGITPSKAAKQFYTESAKLFKLPECVPGKK